MDMSHEPLIKQTFGQEHKAIKQSVFFIGCPSVENKVLNFIPVLGNEVSISLLLSDSNIFSSVKPT